MVSRPKPGYDANFSYFDPYLMLMTVARVIVMKRREISNNDDDYFADNNHDDGDDGHYDDDRPYAVERAKDSAEGNTDQGGVFLSNSCFTWGPVF